MFDPVVRPDGVTIEEMHHEVVGSPEMTRGLPFNAKRYLEALRATDLRGPLRVRALVWVR